MSTTEILPLEMCFLRFSFGTDLCVLACVSVGCRVHLCISVSAYVHSCMACVCVCLCDYAVVCLYVCFPDSQCVKKKGGWLLVTEKMPPECFIELVAPLCVYPPVTW